MAMTMLDETNPKAKIQNAMLLFYGAAEADLAALRREGARDAGGLSLWTSLEAARAACDALILVVESLPAWP